MRNPPNPITLIRAALFTVLLQVAGLLAGGCGDTGGQRVRLDVDTRLAPAPGSTFTNDAGWRITLDRVVVAVGPLVLSDAAPRGSLAGRWLGVRVARAHPGHDHDHDALVELPGHRIVALDGEPAPLGTAEGVTGDARSGTFSFSEERAGPLAGELDGAAVVITGRAERDGATHRFRAAITAAELRGQGRGLAVSGCPLDGGPIAGDGTLTLAFRTGRWLARADFADLDDAPEEEGGAPPDLPEGSQPRRALLRGLFEAAAYELTYAKDPS